MKTKHLSDAELVTHVLLPDDAPEETLHLASCTHCAERLRLASAELDRQRKEHRAAVDDRDATFWKRQELAVMREVARADRSVGWKRSFAAAALVTVAIGGFWFGRTSVDQSAPLESPAAAPIAQTTTSSDPTQEVQVPGTAISTNPWESESLEEFRAVVDWESWVEDSGKDQGTI